MITENKPDGPVVDPEPEQFGDESDLPEPMEPDNEVGIDAAF